MSQSPYNTKTEVLAGFVEVHELGHSFRIGRADDLAVPLPPEEVYSGLKTSGVLSKPNDDTPERIVIRNDIEQRWSIMRLGWGSETLINYNSTTYYVFSLEELSTVQDPSLME